VAVLIDDDRFYVLLALIVLAALAGGALWGWLR